MSFAALRGQLSSALGGNVWSGPQTKGFNSFDDDYDLFLDAATASAAAQHNNPLDFFKETRAQHSLIAAERGQFSLDSTALPWVVCASCVCGPSQTWFVAFRGKRTLLRCLDEVMFCPLQSEAIPNGQIFCGYEESDTKFDPTSVVPWLDDCRKDRVIICGQCLGGAAATAAFLKILQLKQINGKKLLQSGRLKCITFGAPVIGNSAFGLDMKELTKEFSWSPDFQSDFFINIIHHDDMIAKLLSIIANGVRNCLPGTLNNHHRILATMDELLAVYQRPYEGMLPEDQKKVAKLLWNTVEVEMNRALPHLLNMETSGGMLVAAGVVLDISIPKDLSAAVDYSLTSISSLTSLSPRTNPHFIRCVSRSAGDLYSSLESLFDVSYVKYSTLRRCIFHEKDAYASIISAMRPVQDADSDYQRLKFDSTLLRPRIRSDWCTVSRASNVFNITIFGSAIVFLQRARIDRLMTPGETAVVSSKSNNGQGLEIVTFSIQVSPQIDFSSVAREAFSVTFYGLFDGLDESVRWNSHLKIGEISNVDDALEKDQWNLRKDGRFADIVPTAVIDVSVLRFSFLLRAVSNERLRVAVKTSRESGTIATLYDLEDSLFDDDMVVVWLRKCRELLYRLLTAAHPDVLIDCPHVLSDIMCEQAGSSGREDSQGIQSPNRKRTQHFVAFLLNVGLLSTVDGRSNSGVRHLPAELRRRCRASKLRLLHLATRDEHDTITKSCFKTMMDDFRRSESLEPIARSIGLAETRTGSLAAARVAATKEFNSYKIVDILVDECISKEGEDSLSGSAFAARALARSPFVDDCLHVELPEANRSGSGSSSGSSNKITAGAQLTGAVLLAATTLIPTSPVWLAGLMHDRSCTAIGDIDLDASIVREALRQRPDLVNEEGDYDIKAEALKSTLMQICLDPPGESYFRSPLLFSGAAARVTDFLHHTTRKLGGRQQVFKHLQYGNQQQRQYNNPYQYFGSTEKKVCEASIHDRESHRRALEILLLAIQDPFSPPRSSPKEPAAAAAAGKGRAEEIRAQAVVRSTDSSGFDADVGSGGGGGAAAAAAGAAAAAVGGGGRRGGVDGGCVGDMFSLECQLRRRLRGMDAMETVLEADFSSRAAVDEAMQALLAEKVQTNNPLCFLKLLRASLVIHDLRLHLGSTYVICIVGVRGAGKGTIAKNVFQVDAVCGSGDEDSTTDVQSYYIPVRGGGAVQHLLILDLPGSDDVKAHSSLLRAEGFPVADLIIVAGKQERAATVTTVELLKSLVETLGGIDHAIAGKENVRSWSVGCEGSAAASAVDGRNDEIVGVGGDVSSITSPMASSAAQSNEKSKVKEDDCTAVDRSDSDLTRQARKAMVKVVYMMTKADEQLINIVRDREERTSSLSQPLNVDSLFNAATGKWKRAVDGAQARVLAESSWSQLRDECEEHQVERIAFLSCCNISALLEPLSGANKRVVSRAVRAGAVLDVEGVRAFLAQVVPTEVGKAIRGRLGGQAEGGQEGFVEFEDS